MKCDIIIVIIHYYKEINMNYSTCCFTGHHNLSAENVKEIKIRLDEEIDRLINLGVNNFILSGEPGFDQLAAEAVIKKRDSGQNIRLILALPCRALGKSRALKILADEVIYVSESNSSDCVIKCNKYMVDHSKYCICALTHAGSAIAQCVCYALGSGVTVINIKK